MTFRAMYPGRCAASCGSAIVPGDEVVYVDDELVHADCEDVALKFAVGADDVVCEVCFTVKPCPCDDGQGPVAA